MRTAVSRRAEIRITCLVPIASDAGAAVEGTGVRSVAEQHVLIAFKIPILNVALVLYFLV